MGFITDPIADMLVRIKHANTRKFKFVKIPFSKVKDNITKILLEEGYISSFSIKKINEFQKEIHIYLKYKGGQRVITGVKRISKPGLRIYVDKNDIPQVLSGYGISIISTSKGIMSGFQAKKNETGGEVVAYVW